MPRKTFQLTAEQVQALRAGDKQVFRQLFLEFQPRLYRFLWLKLRSVELAEDLVQETFLRLWQTRQRLQADRHIEIYLFRIASNLAIDTLRQQKRRPLRAALENAPLLDPQTSEGAAEYHELTHLIDGVIANLPDGPKTAFILHRYEGLSHAEISAILGISVKTVEKHISKALRVLREALTKLDLLPKAKAREK